MCRQRPLLNPRNRAGYYAVTLNEAHRARNVPRGTRQRMLIMSFDYATPRGTMSPRNWFGVGVRLIGLWQVVAGLDELVTYGNALMRLYTPSYTNPRAF